jgi:DNA primase
MPGEVWIDFKQLKQRVSIEDVLNRYGLTGKLTRKGDQLVGTCPIHHQGGDGQSNKQQFSVNVKKNAFRCWAARCGKKGDQIALVAALEGVEMRRAALLMQEWFGVQSESAPATDRSNAPHEATPTTAAAAVPSAEDMLKENEPLGWFYQSLQPDHPYLLDRLSPATIAEFGKVKARRKGELVEATDQLGFCAKGFHQGRIAIPISDAEGTLMALAGRWVGPEETIPEGEGKYKLPPAEQFRKSLALFSLHRAIANAGPKRIVVVCEGFFQVMKLWEYGYRCCVALMGNSISERQAALLSTHFKAALVFLDAGADAAAAEVAGKLAARGVWVKVIQCPDGKQPDTVPAEELKRLLL